MNRNTSVASDWESRAPTGPWHKLALTRSGAGRVSPRSSHVRCQHGLDQQLRRFLPIAALWYGQDLFINAFRVLHQQRPNRTRPEHHAWYYWRGFPYHAVDRVPVLRKSVRDESIVRRVEHRCVQETIDEHRAGFFVDLILDRCATLWNLDNHVYFMRRVAADRDARQTHRAVS